jgi:hypothetical protein
MFIPFQVDPSWYEKYWWREPAPGRTAYRRRRFIRRFYRAYMPTRERLLRAADTIKVAKNPFAKILSAALRVRHAVTIVDSDAQSIVLSLDCGSRVNTPLRGNIASSSRAKPISINSLSLKSNKAARNFWRSPRT